MLRCDVCFVLMRVASLCLCWLVVVLFALFGSSKLCLFTVFVVVVDVCFVLLCCVVLRCVASRCVVLCYVALLRFV